MPLRNIIKLIIKLALSIAIMAALVSRMELGSVDDMIHRFNPLAWVAATILIIVQLFLVTYRWQVLINIGRTRMSYRRALEVNVASLVANSLFIAAITGVFVKVALSLYYGASLFKSVLATIIDRLMTLAALLFMAALFLPLLGKYLHSVLYVDVCLYMGIFIFLTFVFAPLFFNLLLKHMHRLPFSLRHIRLGTRYLRILLQDKNVLFRVAVTSVIAQFSFFLSVYILVLSTGIKLPFLDMMAVLPLITLISSLPISFGGWGIREGAFIYGFGLLGVPMETAFLISVQTGLIGLLVTALIGLPVLMAAPIDFRRLPSVPSIKKLIFSR